MTTQQKYALFEVPTIDLVGSQTVRVCEGNAMWCVLQLLERLTLTQLHALKLHHIREVQQRVARRTAAECAAELHAQRGAVDGLVVPPETMDLHAEADEDGDEVLEPTPLQEPEVKWEKGDGSE